MASNSTFIPEIQGLRALAVALVLAFHARWPAMSGGYVGVDVFFVISGFLITGLLAREWERTGDIGLLEFYARRAKRLLPASILVTLCTVFVFMLVYAPHEVRALTSTAIATLVYLSNVWFAHNATDYLGGGAEEDPLLHTWSLGVEEQFYLFWPWLLLLLWRMAGGRVLRPAVIAATLVSFALCVPVTMYVQPLGFFMLPTRAWEFGAGALLALYAQRAAPASRIGAEVSAIAGLAMVLLAGVLFDQTTLFPAWAALLPVLGTVLLIRASLGGHLTSIGRVLRTRPLQHIGDISYSLYLWHWPVLVLLFTLQHDPPAWVIAAALALCVVLAHLTYIGVENPLRRLPWRGTRALGPMLAASLAAVAVTAVVRVDAIRGMAQPEQRALLANKKIAFEYLRDDNCYPQFFDTEVRLCAYGEGAGNVAVFGDSHAAHWFNTFVELGNERGWRTHPFVKSACPSIDIQPFDDYLRRSYFECPQWRAGAIDALRELRPDLIVISNSMHYWNDDRRALNFGDGSWERALTNTLTALDADRQAVLVIRDNPGAAMSLPDCLARKLSLGDGPLAPDCSFDKVTPTGEAVDEQSRRAVAKFDKAYYLDPTDVVCPGERCAPQRDGLVLYSDSNHYSGAFATSAPMMTFLEKNLRPVTAAPSPPVSAE